MNFPFVLSPVPALLSGLLAVAAVACSSATPGAPPDAGHGSASPGKATRAGGVDPESVRLTLRPDGLPDDLGKMDAAAATLARREDPAASLFEVVVWPRSADPGSPASVIYSYYLPASRRQIAVAFAHTSVTLPPDQVEAARRAGVLAMMQKSIDDASRPQVTEIVGRRGSPAPAPLPEARVGLRAALAIARRAGLVKLDHAQLRPTTRDPAQRLAIWAFSGSFPGDDESRAIYVDALGGRALTEREVLGTTLGDDRRRSSAELGAALDALRRKAGGGGGRGGGSSCVGRCEDVASQCRAAAFQDTDTPAANAAAAQCTGAEARCISSCP